MVMSSLTPSSPSIPSATAIHRQKAPAVTEHFQPQQISTASTTKIKIEKHQSKYNKSNFTFLTATDIKADIASSASSRKTLTIQNNPLKEKHRTSISATVISGREPFLESFSDLSARSSYSLDFLHSVGAQITIGAPRPNPVPLISLTVPAVRYSTYISSENTSPPTSGSNIRSTLKFIEQSEVSDDDPSFLDLDFSCESITGGGSINKDGIIGNNSPNQLSSLNSSGNSKNMSINSDTPRIYSSTQKSEPLNMYSNYRGHHYYYQHHWNNSINYSLKKNNSRISSNLVLSNNSRPNNINYQQQEPPALSPNSVLTYNSPLSHQAISKMNSPRLLEESLNTNPNSQSALSNFNNRKSPVYHGICDFSNLSSYANLEIVGKIANDTSLESITNNATSKRNQSLLNFDKGTFMKSTAGISKTESLEVNAKKNPITISEIESVLSLSPQHALHISPNSLSIISSTEYEIDLPVLNTPKKQAQLNHSISTNQYNSHPHYHHHPHHILDRRAPGVIPPQPGAVLRYNPTTTPEQLQLSLANSADRTSFYDTAQKSRAVGSDYFNSYNHFQPQSFRHHQQNVSSQYNLSKSPPPNMYHNALAANRNASFSTSGLSSLDSHFFGSDGKSVFLSPTKRQPSLPGNPKALLRGRRYWYPNLKTSHHTFHDNNTPPDRFLAKAHLIETKIVPPSLITDSKWDNLSQDIWAKFVQYQQREDTYRKKIQLWKILYLTIKRDHPRYGLYMVGSTITGFGTDSSDIDMCLVYRAAFNHDSRLEALTHLNYIKDYLCAMGGAFEHFHLIEAKVPILRFRDTQHFLEVDLNFNNCVGIRNTHLLYCYTQLDWRLRPLVLIVKLWAQFHHINNAKTMTISSYSLSLMVIHFLQSGIKPPVLPCLHELYPEKFKIILKSNDFGFVDMIEDIDGFTSQNQQSIGELFVEFLHYFSTFDYAKYAISVRTGKLMSIKTCREAQSLKNDVHQWNELCIEEPFDLTNTARSVYDAETFDRIKNVFILSWKRMEGCPELNQVFTPLVQQNMQSQQHKQCLPQLQRLPHLTQPPPLSQSEQSSQSSNFQQKHLQQHPHLQPHHFQHQQHVLSLQHQQQYSNKYHHSYQQHRQLSKLHQPPPYYYHQSLYRHQPPQYQLQIQQQRNEQNLIYQQHKLMEQEHHKIGEFKIDQQDHEQKYLFNHVHHQLEQLVNYDQQKLQYEQEKQDKYQQCHQTEQEQQNIKDVHQEIKIESNEPKSKELNQSQNDYQNINPNATTIRSLPKIKSPNIAANSKQEFESISNGILNTNVAAANSLSAAKRCGTN